MDGWVKYYLQIILSLGFNGLGGPHEIGLPYEVWMVGQITKKRYQTTSRHFPVIAELHALRHPENSISPKPTVISVREQNITVRIGADDCVQFPLHPIKTTPPHQGSW